MNSTDKYYSKIIQFFGFNIPEEINELILKSDINYDLLFKKQFYDYLLKFDVQQLKKQENTFFKCVLSSDIYTKDEKFALIVDLFIFFYLNFIQNEKKKCIQKYNKYTIDSTNTNPCCGFCGVQNVFDQLNKKNSLGRCTACKIIFYCSISCQKSDYKIHKIFCQKVSKWLKQKEEYEKKINNNKMTN